MSQKEFFLKRALPYWLFVTLIFVFSSAMFSSSMLFFTKAFGVLSLIQLLVQYFLSSGKMANSPKSLSLSLLNIGIKLFVGAVVFLYYFIKVSPISAGNDLRVVLSGFLVYLIYTILLVWYSVKAGDLKAFK